MASPDTNRPIVNRELLMAETSPAQPEETEIDLVQLLYRLVERAKYIVVLALLGAVLMGVYTFNFVTPLYQATAKLYVLNAKDSAVNLSDLQIGAQLTADYQEVFKTWEVHEMVIADLGLDYSYKELTNMLSVTNPNDTRMLYITVTSPSASEAADIANAYARAAQKYISQTMDTDEPNVFSVALMPTQPSSPNKSRNVLLGFLLGFVLACGVITVQFITDDRLRSPDDVERYVGIPTLALVPEYGSANRKKGKESKKKKKAGKEASQQ